MHSIPLLTPTPSPLPPPPSSPPFPSLPQCPGHLLSLCFPLPTSTHQGFVSLVDLHLSRTPYISFTTFSSLPHSTCPTYPPLTLPLESKGASPLRRTSSVHPCTYPPLPATVSYRHAAGLGTHTVPLHVLGQFADTSSLLPIPYCLFLILLISLFAITMN